MLALNMLSSLNKDIIILLLLLYYSLIARFDHLIMKNTLILTKTDLHKIHVQLKFMCS